MRMARIWELSQLFHNNSWTAVGNVHSLQMYDYKLYIVCCDFYRRWTPSHEILLGYLWQFLLCRKRVFAAANLFIWCHHQEIRFVISDRRINHCKLRYQPQSYIVFWDSRLSADFCMFLWRRMVASLSFFGGPCSNVDTQRQHEPTQESRWTSMFPQVALIVAPVCVCQPATELKFTFEDLMLHVTHTQPLDMV